MLDAGAEKVFVHVGDRSVHEADEGEVGEVDEEDSEGKADEGMEQPAGS